MPSPTFSCMTFSLLPPPISTNGKSPTLGKRIRQYLEDALPNNTQSVINGLKSFRDTLKGDFASKVSALNEVTKKLSERED